MPRATRTNSRIGVRRSSGRVIASINWTAPVSV
jgi:hypothetical protein